MRFRNHLRAVPWITFVGLFLLFTAWLLKFDPVACKFFVISYAVIILPVLYLHIEYYLWNRGQVIEITSEGIRVYTGGRLGLQYKTSELEKVVLYKSPNAEKGGIPQLPTEFYFYARVIPRNRNQDIVITSLLTAGRLDEILGLKGVKIETKKAFFPSVHFPLVFPELSAKSIV